MIFPATGARRPTSGRFIMRRVFHAAMAAVAVVCGFAGNATAQQAPVPKFKPEPFWPTPLPENWILGQVSGIAVDGSDNVWVVHRPNSLLDDEKGAMANPPRTRCCKAAPAVI